MKKNILLIAIAILSFVSANAQNYDEENLLGTWVRSQPMDPVNDYLLSIDTLTFCLSMYTYRMENGFIGSAYADGLFMGQWTTTKSINPYDSMKDRSFAFYYNKVRMTNFAITNGNKLHINIMGNFNLIFKIVSFTSDELVIQPLGSTNTIYFSKENATNGVKGITATKANKRSYYNINGQLTKAVARGLTIVKPSNGNAYKVINK